MSTLYVDNLEPNLGSQVEIPDLKPIVGSVINQELVTTVTSVGVSANSLTSVWAPSYTPVSNSSYVFATFSLSINPYRNTAHDARFQYQLYQNSTLTIDSANSGVYDYGGNGNWSKLKYTDVIRYTNSATTAIPYDVKLSTQALCISVVLNYGGTQSQVLFTEIAR